MSPQAQEKVVFEVAPLAGDGVGEDLVRVVVAVDEPGAVGTQHVGPPVLARGDPQRPRRDGLAERHVPPRVVGGGVGDVHFQLRIRLEHVSDRRDVAPELALREWLHSVLQNSWGDCEEL